MMPMFFNVRGQRYTLNIVVEPTVSPVKLGSFTHNEERTKPIVFHGQAKKKYVSLLSHAEKN